MMRTCSSVHNCIFCWLAEICGGGGGHTYIMLVAILKRTVYIMILWYGSVALFIVIFLSVSTKVHIWAVYVYRTVNTLCNIYFNMCSGDIHRYTYTMYCCNWREIASSAVITVELWIWKDLEGSSHGLIKVFSWHFPGMAEENHEKPQSD
jgi:hypothetical protein